MEYPQDCPDPRSAPMRVDVLARRLDAADQHRAHLERLQGQAAVDLSAHLWSLYPPSDACSGRFLIETYELGTIGRSGPARLRSNTLLGEVSYLVQRTLAVWAGSCESWLWGISKKVVDKCLPRE